MEYRIRPLSPPSSSFSLLPSPNAMNTKGKRSIDDSFLYSFTIKDNTRYTLQCVSRLRVSRQAFVGSTEITFNDTKRSRLDSQFTEPVTWIKKKKKRGKITTRYIKLNPIIITMIIINERILKNGREIFRVV